MRILFMGTPDFAAVSLKRLVEDGHEICGVFTQPDKPRNRNKVTFSPVKEYALSQGLTVYQPTKLRDGTALELVKSLAPELIVVVAYGRILPKDILNVPLEKSAVQEIKAYLETVIGQPFRCFNHFMKPYGYAIRKASGNTTSPNYGKQIITRIGTGKT